MSAITNNIIVHFIIFQLMDKAPIFLGLVALLGLLLQKKKSVEVVDGVIKTMIGMVLLSTGAGVLSGTVGPIMSTLSKALNVKGVMPANEAAFGVAMGTKLADAITITFILGFFIHVFLARITPFKNTKNVYLTAHMMFFLSAFLNLALPNIIKIGNSGTIILASILAALYWTYLPSLPRIVGKSFLNDTITIGHCNMTGAFMGHYIGRWFGNKEHDAENLKLPGFLSAFKDNTIVTTVLMILLFLGIGIATGSKNMTTLSGNTNWVVWIFIQSLTFAAGMVILLAGVRMLIAAIVPAFKGISDKIIPNAIPAVDCAAFFPYSPNAAVIGFIGSVIGAFVVLALLILIKSSIVIFPSPIIMVFDGGVVGVFANKAGGWRGSLIAGFVNSFIAHLGLVALYPLMGCVYGSGLMFSNIDWTVVWLPVLYIIKAIGSLFGFAI
jgi:PTS system ascorbate-specific IIC component